MSTNKIGNGIFGYIATAPNNGANTITLNTASPNQTILALSFTPDDNRVVNKIRLRGGSGGGTLGASDVRVAIYSDSSQTPNVSLASSTTVTSGSWQHNAWNEFTGFSLSVTAGTMYWIVISNVGASLTVNYPGVVYGIGGTGAMNLPIAVKRSSTANGSTWTGTTNVAVCGYRVDYADGTMQGIPVQGIVASTNIFTPFEWGVQFVVPPNATLRIKGVGTYINKGGSPTGTVNYKLYTGATPTLQATATIGTASDLAAGQWYFGFFSSPVVVTPGTVVTATLTDLGDTNTNFLRTYDYGFDPDTNSQAMIPWSMRRATFDGSSWTFTTGTIGAMAFALDSSGEFGASLKVSNDMSGGF